jgi:hypothetical protein
MLETYFSPVNHFCGHMKTDMMGFSRTGIAQGRDRITHTKDPNGATKR